MLTARQSFPLYTLALLCACSNDGESQAGSAMLHTVARSPLSIKLVEAGELEAATKTTIRSEVEGKATIIYLIAEGAEVKKGDKLIGLDVSTLIDRQASKKIDLARAEAALVQAEQDLQIQLKEIVASEESAQSDVTIAEMELEKFLGRLPAAGTKTLKATNRDMLADLGALTKGRQIEDLVSKVREDLIGDARYIDAEIGAMAQAVLSQIDEVRLMEADLKIKQEDYEQSKRLFARDFVTRSDLESDEYQYQSQLSKVTLAFQELELLISYNLKKAKIEWSQELRNLRIELERVQANNLARKAREESELRSKQAEFKLAKERLDNLIYQIEHGDILAPTDGLVVYAEKGRGHRREVIEEGSQVYNYQSLIILPDVSKIIAKIRIQEGDIQQVAIEQRAMIKIDAFKDREVPGTVSRIAPLPDSRSRYENKDLKVYITEILLDGENEILRPGMSATVTLEIADLDNVLQIPIEAVHIDGSVNYVWKLEAKGPVATEIKVGAIGMTGVQVLSGLDAGDQIYLSTPRDVSQPSFPQPAQISPASFEEIERAQNQTEAASGDGNSTAATDQLIKALIKKFPDRSDLREPRGLMRAMRDPEIKAALEADPALQALFDTVRKAFMERMRSRGAKGGHD